MKKIATAALSLTLLLSVFLPTFAQRTGLVLPAARSLVQFDHVDAFADGRGVLIEWQMTTESRNAGFYVYRVSGKGLERVSDVMKLGAGLRRKTQTMEGESYRLYDPHGTPDTIYVVQSNGLDGSRISSDETSPRSVSDLALVSGKNSEEYQTAAASNNGVIETILPSQPENQQAPNLVNHRLVVSKPGVKIAVKSEGLYRVTRAELQTAGFNLGSSSANWRLFMEGVEQSIIVGVNDQYVEFYGKGRDDAESDTRVYYLVADSTAGKRMGNLPLSSGVENGSPPNYTATLEIKDRNTYDSNITNGDTSNYYGRPVTLNATVPYVFNLSGVDLTASQNILFTVKLFSSTPGSHSVGIVLNGHNIGSATGDGQYLSYSVQKSVPVSFLVEGANSLELPVNVSSDSSYLDSITISYPRKYQADQNKLRFGSPGRKAAVIGGFSGPNIRVFDTSVAGHPDEVKNLTVVANGCTYGVKIPTYRGRNLFFQASTPDPKTAASGNWNAAADEISASDHGFFTGMKARVSTTGSLPGGVTAGTDYYIRVTGCNTFSLYDSLADATRLTDATGRINFTSAGSGDHTITPSSVLQADSVTANTPSTLSTINHNANFLIITYGASDFIAAANTWANYRRSQGVTAEVVDVTDIYDEYSYGSRSSLAIKSFLSFARSWSTPPQYVMLIGDASYDPRNYEGFSDSDFVPSKFFDSTQTGETVSDDALVDFDGDGLADMSVGRIPARTAADVTTMFNKTVAFEATPSQMDLSRGMICAHDVTNAGDFDFSSACVSLKQQMPGTMPFVKIDRGSANSQTTVINEINRGRILVNYSGHGASGFWATPSFFGQANVPQLTNASNQSIFTMLTCLNGYFIRNDGVDSLAEKLMKATNGGSVAAWASTADTQPDIQLVMGKRFYEQFTIANIKRMGDLVRDAKTAIPYDPTDIDVLYSWVLMGDPMLKVRP